MMQSASMRAGFLAGLLVIGACQPNNPSTAPTKAASTKSSASKSPSVAPSGGVSPGASTSPGTPASPGASTSAGASVSPSGSASPQSGASASPTPSPVVSQGASTSPASAGPSTLPASTQPTTTAQPSGGGQTSPSPVVTAIPSVGVTYTVSTFAGTGVPGNSEGAATSAQFKGPIGLAIDASGVLYVADTLNHRICTVSKTGVVTTLAGTGTAGLTNGSGTSATFSSPAGLVVDGSGTVFVADTNNHCIRRVTSQGVVSTFAGSGSAGTANGSGASASFNEPRGIALLVNGDLLVADSGSNRLRRVSNSGEVTTLVSSGLNRPVSLVPDGSNDTLVVSQDAHVIHKISSSNAVSTFAGTGTSGFAEGALTGAQFNNPNGIARDSAGAVFVVDSGNHRIRMISGTTMTTIAGSGATGRVNGNGSTATFNFPRNVVVDTAGNLYVTDENNHCIRKLTPNR